MLHAATLVCWTLAAKRCLERFLFHPCKTSQSLKRKWERQIFIIWSQRRTERRRLWLQEEKSLVSLSWYMCVWGGRWVNECMCVCVYVWLLLLRAENQREVKTIQAIFSFHFISESVFSVEMCNVSPSSGFLFSGVPLVFFLWCGMIFFPLPHNGFAMQQLPLKQLLTETVSGYSGVVLVN